MKVLVTGGGGFLGSAIVKLLLERGHSVRSISRNRYEFLDALGVEQVCGDLAELKAVVRAVEGCDAVFHVAAKAGVWGKWDDYYRANVLGTRNILEGCKTQRVRKLIYTSTPSVTFAGKDQAGVNESEVYPQTFLAHYPKSKAIAEQEVLAANGKSDLLTVALRPHLIWGPGDNHLIPRILQRKHEGNLRLVGSGANLVDSVYIDNAAAAQVAAMDALTADADCAGKAYFISNDEPIAIKDLINKILAAGGMPAETKSVSPAVAYAAGCVLEAVYGILGLKNEPGMTRFVARQMSTAHWFDISAAKRELNYRPEISIDQGMEILKESLAKK